MFYPVSYAIPDSIEYKMGGGAVLGRTTQEKDLGVTFSGDMKVSEQCGIAASKQNHIIWLIVNSLAYNCVL